MGIELRTLESEERFECCEVIDDVFVYGLR
jgi:hypothetical protein